MEEEESEIEDSEMAEQKESNNDSESDIEDDFVSDQEQYKHLDPKKFIGSDSEVEGSGQDESNSNGINGDYGDEEEGEEESGEESGEDSMSEQSEAKSVEEVKASATKWKSPAARRAEAAAAQEAPIDEGKLKEMHKMVRQVLNRVSE